MAISSNANLRSSIDTSVTDNTDTKRTFVKSLIMVSCIPLLKEWVLEI